MKNVHFLSHSLAIAAVVALACFAAVAQNASPVPPPAAGPSSPAPAYWSEKNSSLQATVLEDTRFSVITNTAIDTTRIHTGEPLDFTLAEDILVDDLLVIPRGARLHGMVVEVKKAGKLAGSPDLILKLVSLDLGGRTYPVYSYLFKVEGASKTRPSENKIKGGTAIGMVTAEAINVSSSAPVSTAGKLAILGTGAAGGAGVATVVAMASPGPAIHIPAESGIDFYLASPISVAPVSRREAERLSEGLHSGGPVLYVRGEQP